MLPKPSALTRSHYQASRAGDPGNEGGGLGWLFPRHRTIRPRGDTAVSHRDGRPYKRDSGEPLPPEVRAISLSPSWRQWATPRLISRSGRQPPAHLAVDAGGEFWVSRRVLVGLRGASRGSLCLRSHYLIGTSQGLTVIVCPRR
jgi:hypothetical protein